MIRDVDDCSFVLSDKVLHSVIARLSCISDCDTPSQHKMSFPRRWQVHSLRDEHLEEGVELHQAWIRLTSVQPHRSEGEPRIE